MKKFTVKETNSLKNFTDNTCAQASMCFRTLLKGKDIKVNGKKVCADMILKKGDEVCYYMSQAQESKKAFEIVYEDANVIVVDKLSGVNSEAVFSEIASCGEASQT